MISQTAEWKALPGSSAEMTDVRIRRLMAADPRPSGTVLPPGGGPVRRLLEAPDRPRGRWSSSSSWLRWPGRRRGTTIACWPASGSTRRRTGGTPYRPPEPVRPPGVRRWRRRDGRHSSGSAPDAYLHRGGQVGGVGRVHRPTDSIRRQHRDRRIGSRAGDGHRGSGMAQKPDLTFHFVSNVDGYRHRPGAGRGRP